MKIHNYLVSSSSMVPWGQGINNYIFTPATLPAVREWFNHEHYRLLQSLLVHCRNKNRKSGKIWEVWTEQSSEHLCGNSMNSSGPASMDFKMTELSLVKCKNVISDIKQKMEDEGDEIAPLLADIWNRNENSCYKNSWAGLRTLNFKNISQRLDENGYESVHDFVKEVQSMLKGIAEEFVFSVEMISEARTIHDLFFEIMERTFENIDFCNARSEVEFPTSKYNTYFLGMMPKVLHVRKKSTEWAKFRKKARGSN